MGSSRFVLLSALLFSATALYDLFDLDVSRDRVMVESFENRTRHHIALVQRCCSKLGMGDALIERCRVHDDSKFLEAERGGYILLTHKKLHPEETKGRYPGWDEIIKRAVEKHKQSNRHHPEFHANVLEMSELDLAEMVCDWAAMAEEVSGLHSPRKFYNSVAKKKFAFGPIQIDFIEGFFSRIEGGVVALDGEPATTTTDSSERLLVTGEQELDTSDLGPIVIRKDGTMGRVQGWAKLSLREQEGMRKSIQALNLKRRQRAKEDL